MRIAKVRRDRLFRHSKPTIRPGVYADIRWMWAAAKRAGFEGEAPEFTEQIEPLLAQADRLYMLEDRNGEFAKGAGPVGMVLANYDGWALVPHVEWFPWATSRNRLRCTVGFLQSMRYTQGIGVIKVFSDAEHADWFKRLKRYLPISLGGKVPFGRADGEEFIFYIRGRKHDKRYKNAVRRVEGKNPGATGHDSSAASSSA